VGGDLCGIGGFDGMVCGLTSSFRGMVGGTNRMMFRTGVLLFLVMIV
jgi:hypothetical protein